LSPDEKKGVCVVDELKSIKDAIKNTILSNVGSLGEEDLGDRVVGRMARDVINQVLSRAGKSKDDIIQILGREIGIALAAMLREPLEQLVESKKIRISVELVGKTPPPDPKVKGAPRTAKSKRR
jgi:hypothetical protein